MNAAQLRALGFDEAADEAEMQQWQGEKARVYASHRAKNPDEPTMDDAPRHGYIAKSTVTPPAAQEADDALMAEYAEYKLTHQQTTGDSVNDALIAAANEHNVKAFEWRRTHPDWRTRR